MSLPQEQPKLVCYTADQIDAVWHEVAPHIQRGLEHGSNYTLEDVREGLKNKTMQLWTWRDSIVHAALVTTIQEDDIKYCLYLAVGGSLMREWLPYQRVIESWAREHGCEEMQIYGRPGWGRKLGFKPVWTKFRKAL